MPGKHDPTTKFMSVAMTRTLWYKLTQYAVECGKTRSDLVRDILETEMEIREVKLTDENLAKVREEADAVRVARGLTWQRI